MYTLRALLGVFILLLSQFSTAVNTTTANGKEQIKQVPKEVQEIMSKMKNDSKRVSIKKHEMTEPKKKPGIVKVD